MAKRYRRRIGWAGALAAACALVGCNRAPQPPANQAAAASAPVPAATFTPMPQGQPGVRLAYVHAIGLNVAGAALPAHFAAARDHCLNTPALHCLLLSADLVVPTPGQGLGAMPSGSLRLRLPHDQVAPFANALTAPLPGEAPGAAQVVHQATTAEDLSHPIQDTAQRVAQLADYLASLKALGSRLTISVTDLVKIAGETAQAQTEIEEAQAQARDLAQRVDTEELDIDFGTVSPVVQNTDPVRRVLDGAQASLRLNAADALQVAIAALPWVPLGVLGLVVLRLVLGRRRRV